MTIPTYEDYVALRDGENINYGYGIVYGDGATGVQTDMTIAHGFTNYDNDADVSSIYGVRACILYNSVNGDQILFPIGAEGQGRRARSTWANTYRSAYNGTELKTIDNPGFGSLTYSGARTLLYSGALNNGRSNNYRPLTYNIYREPGAIYWFKKPARRPVTIGEDDRCASWDINYYTLVFNPYDSGSLGEKTSPAKADSLRRRDSSDALPIKLIYK